ncbi:uncharacterized protein L3040_001007 [Drepanopeziza brunnea f. sp. 'multigermtubi']|uniref:uncharacterized protein n=1 Tax=Drepanopeziza brunnea f. sp. 'multigermtubi' TaxID=698441 RepID=UPI0023A1FCA2|nr:hypothetical protein L3040_001007 [Drepanopeziza brunnea f. sp. 'multigermtubi']
MLRPGKFHAEKLITKANVFEMSAFSRGLLLRHQCAFKVPRAVQFFPAKTCQHPRLFSSSKILRAAKKTHTSQTARKIIQKQPSLTPITPIKGPTPASHTVYQTYASQLAQKSHPTLLYQAPSHTAYMIACYGTAGFCFTYATISFWSNYIMAPPDISKWVPIAFGGISFLMAALGGWLILGPARLVRSISAIPRSVSVAQKTLSKKATVPELQIEIELKKMLPIPFFPARKIYVKANEVELPCRFVPLDKKLSIEEQKQIQRQKALEKEQLEEHYRKHFLTFPLRRMGTAMSKGAFAMFIAMKRIWTRDGMMMVEVKESKLACHRKFKGFEETCSL